ncbi:hypothetical protein [Sphingomonas oryzagri]
MSIPSSRSGARLAILGALLASSGCATFGGHVKGSFACKAPQGTCEPMSSIDARAIGSLGHGGGGGAMPESTSTIDGDTRLINAGYGNAEPARSGDRVMRVVFPAHTDGNGIWHEESVAHFVSEPAGWVPRPASEDAPVAGSLDAAIASQAPSARPVAPAPVAHPAGDAAYAAPGAATSTAPLTLREAAAGLEAPRDTLGDVEPSPVLAMDVTPGSAATVDADAPTMAAIAAARAGHRIGQPMPARAGRPVAIRANAHGSRHGSRVVLAPQPVATDYTRALNQDALARAKGKEVGSPAPSVSIAAVSDGATIHAASNLAQPGPVEQAVSGGSARP